MNIKVYGAMKRVRENEMIMFLSAVVSVAHFINNRAHFILK